MCTLARYVNVKACRSKLGLLGEDHSKGFSVSLLKGHLLKRFPSLLRRNAKAGGSWIQGHRCFYYCSRSWKYIPVLLDLGRLIKTGRSGVYDQCGSHNTHDSSNNVNKIQNKMTVFWARTDNINGLLYVFFR